MLTTLRSFFANTTASFLGASGAIGLIAIPTYVWLPREFDHLNAKFGEAEAVMAEASTNSKKSSEATDRLIAATARIIAQPLADTPSQFANPAAVALLSKLVPPDLVTVAKSTGALENMYLSTFDGDNWIFVSQSSFNSLPSSLQDAFEKSALRSSFHLIVEPDGFQMMAQPSLRKDFQTFEAPRTIEAPPAPQAQ